MPRSILKNINVRDPDIYKSEMTDLARPCRNMGWSFKPQLVRANMRSLNN